MKLKLIYLIIFSSILIILSIYFEDKNIGDDSLDDCKKQNIMENVEAEKVIRQNVKFRKVCFAGLLFYDWDGRPFGVCIPVLKNDAIVNCE